MNTIVAAEVAGNDLLLFRHDGQGGFSVEKLPFRPWCLAADGTLPPAGAEPVRLAGSQPLKFRWEFPDVETYDNALDGLKRLPGVVIIRDLVQQALSISGLRLFEGMLFTDLRRMQFSVNADEKSRITSVETNDPINGVRTFSGEELDILEAFNAAVKDFDPDLLEGYNCCRSDLVCLKKRADKLKFVFDCARDGSGFSSRPGRFTAAEKQISVNYWTLRGRHIVDVSYLALFYDAVHRDFESFDLEYLRRYFAVDAENTTDIIEKLAAMLEPAYFYRSRTLPMNYQHCITRGSGAALDAMFIAEYQYRGHSVPFPQPSRRFAGALSGAEATGVFHNVRHCDVRSLYPSILLFLNKTPVNDELGVFLEKLAELRKFRLEAKDRAASLPPGNEKNSLQALQNSFKILINSFYGYLGFAQGSFNDYDLAETVTACGRELLGKLAQFLQDSGAKIIEMDTDGIYFCDPELPPDEFDASLKAVLPPGIELDFDAEYPAMYSYKAKNYALLHKDDTVTLSGAALKARSLENYQRRFIRAAVEAKLRGRPEIMENCYAQLKEAILQRTIPLEDLAKSEILSDSPENYRRKQSQPGARRSAAYELILSAGSKYRSGDQVRFYMIGEKAKLPVVGNSKLLEKAIDGERDENTAYYSAKLDELYNNFKE